MNAAADVICRAQKNGTVTPAGIAMALESAKLLQSPEAAAELARALEDLAGANLARWEEEQENARLRARVAELEQQAAMVAEFVADRAGYIVAIRNCHPDNGHDYNRWQGHAESRRQLAQALGLPVAWPPEDNASVAKSADRLTQLFAPTQLSEHSPEPELVVYRASHDSIVMDLYTTVEAARAHCEALLHRETPDVSLDWIDDEDDGVAELTAWIGGEECTTGYVVTPLTVASEYNAEADE